MSDVAETPILPAGLTRRDTRAFNRWIDEVASGVGPLNAGAAVGWSPAKVKRLLADPEVAEMVTFLEERKDETAEQGMYELVKMRHFQAIQWWLLNRRQDRWKDTKRIVVDHEHHIDGNVVVSVKHAALELIREAGVAALQPGSHLDILDADVVSDTADLVPRDRNAD